MSRPTSDDAGDFSLLELFRVEAENQVAILTDGLLEVERDPTAPKPLEALMRAAHSLKGAARIVNLPVAARVAHAMEDCFVAAQRARIQLGKSEIDVLLRGVDFFTQISRTPEAGINQWEADHAVEVDAFIAAVAATMPGPEQIFSPATTPVVPVTAAPKNPPAPKILKTVQIAGPSSPAAREAETGDRMVRLTAETVNRLLGLAGESLVESRRLPPLTVSMQRLKRLHFGLADKLDDLRQSLAGQTISERAGLQLNELLERLTECREFLAGRIDEMETLDRVATRLSNRLYQETLQCRMRPFGDVARVFPRSIRDLARALGKLVRLEVSGENTQVDRDVLEKLEAPLTHLLRNALDHGCEFPEERRRQNKPPEAVVRLEARHSAGRLLVSVADDGQGVDPEKLRAAIVRKHLVAPAVAEKLSRAELMEFLFLPGFTMKNVVTEISGRGVGLDVVRNMVKAVRGKINVTGQPGRGARFELQLPITLSVIRALLVEVADEPLAIPLAQIVHTLKVPKVKVRSLEGRRYFAYGDAQVGLTTARQVLEYDDGKVEKPGDELLVVVFGDPASRHGLIVDRFLGQKELVVQPLDPRLGKVRNISAAATMEDGSPVLIVDVEDMVHSIEKLAVRGLLCGTESAAGSLRSPHHRRVLVVDDSLTVRAAHQKLLREHGYHADVSVDGVDGWGAVRTGDYDLVITDVDMPRMDGLELTALIKSDPRLQALPVLMVSHKDRPEDRRRGLAAGASEYLTKSGFQDERLLEMVRKLLGEEPSGELL